MLCATQREHGSCGELDRQEDAGSLPFHINVAHLLPREAQVIQDHISCIPDNTTQEKPGERYDSNPPRFPTRGWEGLGQEAKKPRSRLVQEDSIPAWLDTGPGPNENCIPWPE